MTQFVEQLRNQAKWYAQPGHNARDLMDSRLLEKAADEIERLAAKLEAAEKERDALRAKIEHMENQEPVAWLHETRRDSDVVTDAVKHVWGKVAVGSMAAYSIPLYALPGAQKVPSISPVALRHVIQWLRNGCDPMKAADELEMLAAAPEAKP